MCMSLRAIVIKSKGAIREFERLSANGNNALVAEISGEADCVGKVLDLMWLHKADTTPIHKKEIYSTTFCIRVVSGQVGHGGQGAVHVPQ